MPQTGFQGLRVLALETRRAKEIATLVRNCDGEPLVVSAMREVPLESNRSALDFAAALLRGEFDLVVFLTGVGVRALVGIVEKQFEREKFLVALRKVKVAARGPKSLSVLRELAVPAAITAGSPNTWRELMAAIETELGPKLDGLRVAVQEYGAPATDLLAALAERKAHATPVPVYQWALPENLQPLRDAILAIAQGKIDVLILMNAAQADHLFLVADQMGRKEELLRGLQSTVVLSIGPSTTGELSHLGVVPDFEPSSPKMGVLVNEASKIAQDLVRRKRAASTGNG